MEGTIADIIFLSVGVAVRLRRFLERGSSLSLTASLGFEPRQSDSESLVLPLHYEAKARGTGKIWHQTGL